MSGASRALALGIAAALIAACSPGAQDQPEVIDDTEVPFQLLDTTSTSAPTPSTSVLDPQTLFFVVDEELVPVSRGDTEGDDPLMLLRNLVAGPTPSESALGIGTAIPSGTRIRRARVRGDGTLVVQLVTDLDGAEGGSALAIGQLVLTAAGDPDVERVLFQLDGEPVQVPQGDGTLVQGPVSPRDYAELLAGG